MCRLFLNVGRTGFGVIFRDENVYVLVPVAKFMKEEFDVNLVRMIFNPNMLLIKIKS